jgi:thymidylate synthase
MRSNDVYLGLPHDIFSFTMIQEIVASTLGVPLGIYSHFVGSLHVYEHHRDRITAFIREGWQGTTDIMPEMPPGDPWPGVAQLLRSELAIREGVSFRELDMPENPYWADLVRLLAVYSSDKRGDYQAMREIRQLMDSPTYDIYVSSRIDREVSS